MQPVLRKSLECGNESFPVSGTMNVSFRTGSLEPRNPQQSSTVPGSRNACHGCGQGNIAQESSQSLLLHHMSPDQGEQPAQEPRGRQVANSVSPGLPTSSRFSYDSLEQVPASAGHQPREASNVQGQRIARVCSRLFTIWTVEILSCLIASVCLAAILGILITHQGLPLPQWPLNITINALIAIFTAIFKMALMVPVAEGE